MNTTQKLLSILPVVAISIFAWPKASARPGEGALTWSIGASPSVCLSIRDKYAYLGNYRALFIIEDSKGNKAQKIISVHGNEYARVYYSADDGGDFKSSTALAQTGNFSWVCIVNNEVAAKGKFNQSYVGNDEQIRTFPTRY